MTAETRPASLEEILTAREQRVERQQKALTRWGMTVLSLTIVMPGPHKDSGLARFLFEEALREIDSLLDRPGWKTVYFNQISQTAGPETIYVVDADARELKRALLNLEDTHPLGRLWDIDIIDPNGTTVSRRDLGMAGRRCLVCGEAGHACARSRAHTLSDLMKVIEETVSAYRNRQPV